MPIFGLCGTETVPPFFILAYILEDVSKHHTALFYWHSAGKPAQITKAWQQVSGRSEFAHGYRVGCLCGKVLEKGAQRGHKWASV